MLRSHHMLSALAASIGVAAAVLAAAGPALATATSVEEQRDLDLFQSWLHSPVTVAILATVWLMVAALAFTSLGERFAHRTASDTFQALIVVIGVLATLSWVTQVLWFRLLIFLALWAIAVWYIVTLLWPALSKVQTIPATLDASQRREAGAELSEHKARGEALERVLDEAERSGGGHGSVDAPRG